MSITDITDIEIPVDTMFTSRGNKALADTLKMIEETSEYHDEFWNRATLRGMAKNFIEEYVGNKHPEVYDAPAINIVGNFLNSLCKKNGWEYDVNEGYDL